MNWKSLPITILAYNNSLIRQGQSKYSLSVTFKTLNHVSVEQSTLKWMFHLLTLIRRNKFRFAMETC